MNSEITIDRNPRFRGVTALANRLGVSHTHLSRILHGQREPGRALAEKLKKAGITMPIQQEV